MGIAHVGGTMVVVGSLMFDFDTGVMARALKVPSEKMRDKVQQSLQDYMTTIRRELGELPPRDSVKETLVENLRRTLDVELWPGKLSAEEERVIEGVDRRFLSPEWLRQKGGLPGKGVKIKAGMRVVEADHKVPGGLVRVTARVHEGAIDDLSLSGDFTFYPAERLSALEGALRGATLDEVELAKRIAAFYSANGVQSPGVSPEDMARALMLVADEGGEG